jgi:hypothetical protein
MPSTRSRKNGVLPAMRTEGGTLSGSGWDTEWAISFAWDTEWPRVGHSVTGVGHSVVRKSSYEAAFAANDLKIAAAI